MTMFNSFWPVYKNLEEETLTLSKYIYFTDDQLEVYSMYIADMIMRIAVEIEALSKELYKNDGGPQVFDDNGKERDPFFDTECIKYLNDKWNICNRQIIVSCTNFNFSNQDNYILKPLHKADKRGSSSAIWNKAYQAVKHDRRTAIKRGNIKALIHALGALYILNIYYRNDLYEYGSIQEPNKFFDNRLGSSIFAATFADASQATISNDASDTSICSVERKKLETALCIIKYTNKAWDTMHSEFQKYKDSIIPNIIREPEFLNRINDSISKCDNDFEKIVLTTLQKMESDYIRKKPPKQIGISMIYGEKEVVLNKGQAIYPS